MVACVISAKLNEKSKLFTDEKNLLWDASDESIIGKKIVRQGASKGKSEINDIEIALTTMAENAVVPLFIGSSTMIMQKSINKMNS